MLKLRIHLLRIFISTLTILLFLDTFLHAQPNGEGLVVGKKYKIFSQVLNEERIIYVYLPDGYRQSEEKYPVAYLLDGYEHFHYTSGIIKALAGNNKIPQMIVIGILNVDRYRDFTPYQLSYFPTSGGSDKFTKFLKEELFPFVEKYYKTEPHRLLIGHSLAGLFAIHTLMENNELFNSYIAPSPALLHVDSVISTDYPSKLKNLTNVQKSIFFTIGGEESSETISCATNLQNVFIRNAPSGINWKFNFMENDNHTSLIFNSIYEGLLMNYSGWEVPVTTAKGGIDAVIKHYEDLSQRFEYDIRVTAHLLNAVGKKLINQKAYDAAINLLEKGVEIFPKSAALQNNLGVVYEFTGQLNPAKESYDKACMKAALSKEPYYALYVENLNNVLSKLDNKIYKKVFEAQLL